jgi:uncharacterized protein
MHVVISGGSGFVGQEIQKYLIENGDRVTILTRSQNGAGNVRGVNKVQWLNDGNRPEEELSNVDAIVNLAGETISGSRWTKSKKKKILESRLNTTREIIRIIANLETKPKVLINASAVGCYGMSETDIFTETSTNQASDFLASVVRRWEFEALKAEELNVRTVLTRFGVILGNGGAMPLMVLPYKLGVGGTIGSGKQWLSWIHINDVVRIMVHIITHPEIEGSVNLTAPEPVRMKEFGKSVSTVLGRPHWLPVPSIAMKLVLGEMSEMLLKGQYVIPEKAIKNGYTFQYKKLLGALENLM